MNYLEEFYKREREYQQEQEKKDILRKSRLPQGDNPLGFIPIGSPNVGKSDYATAMAMAMALYTSALPKFKVEIDPITEGGDGSLKIVEGSGVTLTQTSNTGWVADITKEKEEQLKQKKMKTKNFYHTFEYEQRKITLCLHVEEQYYGFSQRLMGENPTSYLEVGYAVCVPEDEFSQELAKRISLGRATKEGKDLEDFALGLPTELAFDLGILKALAHNFERRIKNGEVVIKGIRPSKEED